MSQTLLDNAVAYLEFKCREGRGGKAFTDPDTSKLYFKLRLDDCRDREHFDVVFLNSAHRLIDSQRLFSGTIDGSEVHPRVIVRAALLCNAAAIIVAHNHPSGNLTFSTADRVITQKIKTACEMFDIRVLDHVLVGCGQGVVSGAEQGWV